MKVIECTKYGTPDVLEIIEVEKPTPKKNEVLVKIYATTVTIGDVFIRTGKHPDSKFYTFMLHLVFGWRKPKNSILGMEIAGKIETVGEDVTLFKEGDSVFASTYSLKFGGYAEYKCFPENGMIVKKPTNISYEEAATIPGGGMTALRCLRRGKIKNGDKVLIIGASGAVGSNAVQLAKNFEAEVTGVCSTSNIELVKSLGADFVIDYTKEDLSSNNKIYDIVFDAVAKVPSSTAKKLLKKEGTYINVLKHSGNGEDIKDLDYIKKLVEYGKIKPVIDKYYSFKQIKEAHSYVEKGHKKGNVVITMEQNFKT